MGPGGLEHVVLDLIDHLDRELFDIQLLCIHRILQPYEEKLSQRRLPFHFIDKNQKGAFGFYAQLLRLFRTGHFDVVHAHSGCFVESMLPAKLAGVKHTVFTAHGLPIRSRLSGFQEPIAALAADKITAVSDEIGMHLRRQLHCRNGKIEVVLNGINLHKFYPVRSHQEKQAIRERFGLPRDAVIIGMVGRLVALKNYPMLLAAFCTVLAHTTQRVHLVIVGRGPERRRLEKFCEDMHIAESVNFLGNRDDISTILKAFDIFSMSSQTEGTSISLLESQATGLPAVVTDVGGNRMIIDHEKNGFVVPDRDELAMSKRLLALLDHDRRVEMGKHARQKVKARFDVRTMVNYYQHLYMDYAGQY